MKNLIIAISMLSSAIAFGKPSLENKTLANEGDTISLSNIAENQITIFLSYAGKMFDHCGISISSKSPGISAERLLDSFEIRVIGNVAEISGNKLVARVQDPEEPTFGQYFTIATKSGESIRAKVAELTEDKDEGLVAEILPCRF